jgi:hypothetical protein
MFDYRAKQEKPQCVSQNDHNPRSPFLSATHGYNSLPQLVTTVSSAPETIDALSPRLPVAGTQRPELSKLLPL